MIASLLSTAMLVASAAVGAPQEPMVSTPDVAASDCQADRRCRLRAFAERMREQRAEESRQRAEVAQLEKAAQEKALRETEPVRRHRRLEADITASTNRSRGIGGLQLGWGFTENWRAELFATYFNQTLDPINGSGYSYGARVRWIPFDWQVAPYAALGLQIESLSLHDGADTAAAHKIELAFGVDWQARFGLHIGAEFGILFPIYEGAWDSMYIAQDAAATASLSSELSSEKFGGNFFVGWAWDL